MEEITWVAAGTVTACPKCGSQELRRCWEEESASLYINGKRYGYQKEPYPERIVVTCQTCHYQWVETPKDALAPSESEQQIEKPTMTFTEAVAAMDARQTVEHGECLFRKRAGAHVYEYKAVYEHKAYDDLGWAEAEFDFQDIHATDWRIVREEPQDELPTQEEFAVWLASQDLYGWATGEWRNDINIPRETANPFAQVIAKQWPAMFRKEDE